ncbi:MAG: outer membrane beta-barrel protein [Calditrichaeota bacterium]|nr:outer membrane beta-barrel protein [Calditrichota bacterium]MCB9369382.1 outer membrane beta-barrel protein [Calditrichota bacterium]
MKRLFMILCLLFISVTTLYAAAPRLGVKGGLMFGNVDEEIPDQVIHFTTKNRTGLVLGAWGEIPLVVQENFAVRGDLLYTQKGATYEIFGGDITVIADEMTIAPFLVYYLPVKVVRPFLEIGPELGLTVSDGTKVDGDSFNSNGNWKDANFSLNVGGGVEFGLGGKAIALELKYNLGLTDMGGWGEDAPGAGKTTAKTYGVQVLASVALF